MKLCSARGWWYWVLPFVVTAATAQVATSPAPAASAPPVPYASVSQLNLLLSQLEQMAQATQLDLAKLRIDKWKTDSGTKRGTEADVESLQRNLQMALPEIAKTAIPDRVQRRRCRRKDAQAQRIDRLAKHGILA